MPDPTTTTYLGISGWIYLWVLAVIALVIFGRRAYLILAAVGRGRAEARWDQLPRRLWNVVVNVAGQRRMFDNLGMGLAHRAKQRFLGDEGGLVNGAADTDSHDDRRAGVGTRLLHTLDYPIHDPLPAGRRREHLEIAHVLAATTLGANSDLELIP